MKLNLEIDLNNDSREQIAIAANFLNTITNAARRSNTSAQPAVAENTGNVSQGSENSPGDGVVVGAGAKGAEPEPSPAPTVVKEAVRRGRPPKVKEEAAAPVEKPADTPEVAAPQEQSPSQSEPAAAAPASLTLDDVRTALQNFTGSKGVPAGIELLGEFGAKRISELKPEHFVAFIEKCNG